MVRATQTDDSKGNAYVTEYRYPFSYLRSFPIESGKPFALPELLGDNRSGVVIEELNWIEYADNSQKLIKATLNKYKTYPAGFEAIERVYKLTPSAPLGDYASAQYDRSSNFMFDSRYTLELSDLDYDNLGNLRHVLKPNSIHTSYLWGYSKSLPVAIAVNASKDQIAYTSFETDEVTNSDRSTNWLYVPGNRTLLSGPAKAQSGRYGYLLNAGNEIIRQNLDPSREYIVSFYAWNSAGAVVDVNGQKLTLGGSASEWTPYLVKISGSSTVSVMKHVSSTYNINIDELRLYPVGAQMTTYTYDPLRGITSQTDPAGVTTYSEYDELGRLKLVRNPDRNILNHYYYYYKK
jgi:YD repeat-containing protein